MRLSFVLLILALAGCSDRPVLTTPTAATSAEADIANVFRGPPADKRIGWDLAGTWSISRFGTKEKPGKLGRWEAKWTLVRMNAEVSEHDYRDENGQGKFWLGSALAPEKVGPDRVADTLVWQKPDGNRMVLSINEQSFGLLMMTGDDDEQYLAVRSD